MWIGLFIVHVSVLRIHYMYLLLQYSIRIGARGALPGTGVLVLQYFELKREMKKDLEYSEKYHPVVQ